MEKILIQILSVPYREKLIAEIQYEHYAIAEINIDNGIPEIEIFSYDEKKIIINFDEFIEVLIKAKCRLLEI